MTREQIIRMAREAECEETWGADAFRFGEVELERFVAIIAAAEREACAQIVQSYMDEAYIGDEGWNVARDILNDIQGKK